jgi:ferredoxin-NADP reductase
MLLTNSISKYFRQSQNTLIRNSPEESKKAQAYWERIALQTRSPHQRGRIIETIQETPNAISFRFEPADGSKLSFNAGQHITLHCKVAGKAYHRPYSLSCSPTSGKLQFTVKSVKDGEVSNYLINNLKAGQVFEFSKVNGDFQLSDKACSRLMIAAGAGITPIRSLLESALQKHPDHPIQLLYLNRSKKEAIFYKELDTLAQTYPQLQIQHWFTQATSSTSALTGKCTESAMAQWLSQQPHPEEMYLCGPEAFMQLCETSLKKSSLKSIPVFKEAFTAAPQPLKEKPKADQLIRFTKSNKEIRTRNGESILEAALRAGVNMDYSCQMGGCGCCKTLIKQGDVVSEEPNCLSEKERNEGYRLACLSYACNETLVDA